MLFKNVSSIPTDTKDSYSNISYELFELLIGYTYSFDLITEFSGPLLKTHIVCIEK